MRITTANIKRYSVIKLRDYSDYDPQFCHDGGRYAFGENLYPQKDGTVVSVPWTSGDFCPNCHQWSCNCKAEDMEQRISAIEAVDRINSYSKGTCEIEFTERQQREGLQYE